MRDELASQLDATPGLAVWDRGEWALIRGTSFAWLLTRRIPDRPLPFVDPQSHAQAQQWLDGLDDARRMPTRLDREWHAATLTAEGTVDDALDPLPAGYLAEALARGVVYGPQIATLRDGTRTVGRLPERR